MILILVKEIDLGRYVEVFNIYSRKKFAGLQSIAHINWPTTDLSQLNSTETLYISAHGSNDEVEEMTPDQLASLLVSKGLRRGVSFKKIKLMSCGSGLTRGSNVPYCKRLATALAQNNGPNDAVIIGFDGETTVCAENGVLYAKNTPQSSYPNWSVFANQHSVNFNNWNKIAKQLSCKDQNEFLKNAQYLLSQPEVKAAFAWLYTENAQYVLSSGLGKTFATQKDFGKDKVKIRNQMFTGGIPKSGDSGWCSLL